MRGCLRAVSAVVLATAALAAAATPPAQGQTINGEWRNMKNTVHIRAYPCGDAVCGTIIWASPKAQASARDKGTNRLEGTQIFREFRPTGDGGYTGRVYVPTMGRTFSGRLRVMPDDTLIGKGCVLGGLFCKSTTWVRLN
ncbi:hypothetical protein ASE86_11080 [Sphingomonas sp. Leaf33]|uniref:DUF2147 domain-containing protein n=1 Tax=Sphingomonas sp. Leaf33 TaxID=1736215 RepID=UPI0006F92F88|nr:DUF2147 domain-containing protein [Sphingomonas sp. Leaf33]KQN26992.1 hypothetical protein ASE86_11080 [Sphingomonas sp. Leaf33]